MTSKAERQKMHLEYFGSNCDCEACVNDYPMGDKLVDTITDIKLCSYIVSKLSQPFGTPKEISTEFRCNCYFIEKFAKQRPCYELFCLAARNIQILTKLATIMKPFSSIEN